MVEILPLGVRLGFHVFSVSVYFSMSLSKLDSKLSPPMIYD